MKKTLKFLHELGTIGVTGVVVVQMVLATVGAEGSDSTHAAYRAAIRALDQYVLIPSLLMVMTSGALAIAFHRPFHNADWAIVKALMTPLVLEGTFMAVMTPAKAAAKLSERVAAGEEAARAALDKNLSHEWGGLIVMLVMFSANIVLAIWRPRLRRKHRPSSSD